ncbi:unnamed protein product [Effrenium voratum]|uniref:Methyltransferase domain-containing protein n=1 Tax=Effrenium voratum TaxID=2562239 RepID=A0AA36I7G8_9DINO|nr:unnamed protein product [Effrenium voratum]
MGRLASALELLLKPTSFATSDAPPDAEPFNGVDLEDERPDAGSYDYWQERAPTYDEDIYKSSEEDQGLIRGEIEAAAARARRGRGWADGVCDAPHRGECAAGGRHEEVPEGFLPGQGLLAIDAGCGPGLWLRGLSSRFSHVIGLDQSQNLLEKAKENHEELLNDKSRKVDILPAVDLGQPCVHERGQHGEDFCGPGVPGAKQQADLVASFNVLISPNKESRENILRREAEMLRPDPSSTLLLLVPSAESYRRVRDLYQQQGVDSNLGRYIDYETPHPEEEAENVFRVYAKTKHYTKKEACDMVEKVGLSCDKVLSYPMRWRYVYPYASDEALEQLKQSHRPPAHEWIVVAHPKASAGVASTVLSRAPADFL